MQKKTLLFLLLFAGIFIIGICPVSAATLYAKAGGGNWSDPATWSATGSSGSDDAGVPGLATDVVFDSGSGNVTINSFAYCRSLDTTSGNGNYTGIITHNTGNTLLFIGDSTAGAGNVALRFNSSMRYNPANSSAIIMFTSSSATPQIIDYGSQSAGSVDMSQANNASYIITSSISILLGGYWNNPSSTINNAMDSSYSITMYSPQFFVGGNQTYGDLIINGIGSVGISGTNTFSSLTRTGSANKTDTLIFYNNQIITGTLTLDGNSATNRLLIKSDTIGTRRTLTAGSVVASNADFEDIAGAGAGNWNLSAISGKSGDAGGNSGITFTPAANQYWKKGSSDNWSTIGNWFLATNGGGGAGRVPLPQDTAIFDNNSVTANGITITQDMPRIGSVDFSGVNHNPTFNTNTITSVFGSITLDAGMVYSGTAKYTFEARSTASITSAGLTITNPIVIDTRGTVRILDTFISSNASGFTLNRGTLQINNNNVTVQSFLSSNNNSRMVQIGNATISLTASGTAWNTAIATNFIFLQNGGTTSAIKYTNSTNSAVTFAGGGVTYPNPLSPPGASTNLWFSRGASTGNITITGSNTFTDFKDTGTSAHSILFATGTTQHVTTFTVSGSVGNIITINSTNTGTHSLVKNGGGFISSDYLNIQHSVAGPTSTWYAGTHSINNQAVATAGSGWLFVDPFSNSPILNQNHYRWRDDSTALNTNGGYLASTDVPANFVSLGSIIRLRIEIANTNQNFVTAHSVGYRLESAIRNGAVCGDDETFTAVPVNPTTESWQMIASSQYSDGASITTSFLPPTPPSNFINGLAVEPPSNQTASHSMAGNRYSEFEYALKSTANVNSQGTYCFRLTNRGSTTNFLYEIFPQVSFFGTLIIKKHVINDNGGTATANNFTLHVKTAGADVSGSPTAGSEAGVTYILPPGNYIASEDNTISGYRQEAGFGIDCDSSGNVVIASGQTKNCMITNNDNPVLVVQKVVVNNGGNRQVSDFQLFVNTQNPSQNNPVSSGAPNYFNPGVYGTSETSLIGYIPTYSIDCSGTLADGDAPKLCTITNTEQAGTATNLTATNTICFATPGSGLANFSWNYTSPQGNTESKFQFQMTLQSDVDYTSPVINRTFSNLSYPSGSLNQQSVLINLSPVSDTILYGTSYRWRVAVWDSNNSSSGFTNGVTYLKGGHPDPAPSFTYVPQNPYKGGTINFTNTSNCYNASGPVACQPTYLWDFGDSSTVNTKDASHAYVAKGTYTLKLRAYDEIRYCELQAPLPVGNSAVPLPIEKEIAPF